MIRLKFLCFLLLVANGGNLFAQASKRVLFLGNSYTYVNNLPQLCRDVALSAGDTLAVDVNANGGQTLQGHFTDNNSISKINQANWDYVVLQEQSQRPSFSQSQVEVEVFPYARGLDTMIKAANACTETIFYMTWGRKNGDAGNCAVWPPVCTYSGMDSMLYLRYMAMANDNEALVSPVGQVWKYLRANHPLIELYQPDESHPSAEGSYAAACCFYAIIFQKNPLLITYDFNLNAAVAADIRQAAKVVVFDSLSDWNVGRYAPQANFSSYIDSFSNISSVTFTNNSIHYDSVHWDFGDGSSSNAINPIHTYNLSVSFRVVLTVFSCGQMDTFSQIVVIPPVVAVQNIQNTAVSIYPNPTSGQLFVESERLSVERLEIIDVVGKIHQPIYQQSERRIIIDIHLLPAGAYWLRMSGEAKVHPFTIIK